MNLYTYVGSEPVNMGDPRGMVESYFSITSVIGSVSLSSAQNLDCYE